MFTSVCIIVYVYYTQVVVLSVVNVLASYTVITVHKYLVLSYQIKLTKWELGNINLSADTTQKN